MSPADVHAAGLGAGARRSGVTIAIVVMVIIGLAGVDRFLAQLEANEARASAERSFDRGSRLLAQGNASAAVDSLREAHALDRRNVQYTLKLVSGLSSAGKAAEAESSLNDVLVREPNDGEANLIAARLSARKGDFEEAQAYYHRAIYGEWKSNAEQRRIAARMELVNLLLKTNQKQQLLAELISLEAEPSATPSMQLQVAELFMKAGAAARAETVYQMLSDADPADIHAAEGVGNAALQLGQYRVAREAYERAVQHHPEDASVHAHLRTLNTVIELDPTLRQLASAEKYRRSMRILDMTREALAQCAGAADSGEDAPLLKDAADKLNEKKPAAATNEAAEAVLSLAEKIWKGAQKCDQGRGTDADSALGLIMKKLAS